MAGHVFVVRGDLTQIGCDAWLLPTDRHGSVLAHWRRSLSHAERAWVDEFRQTIPEGWETSQRRAVCLPAQPGRPVAVLTNTGAWRVEDPGWHIAAIEQFALTTMQNLSGDPDRFLTRSRPLLALPLIGGGAGGAGEIKGDLVKGLLLSLRTEAERHDCDFALVAYTAADFGAAQRARNLLEGQTPFWESLNPNELGFAGRLGDLARQQQLVLFLGAGVSIGAGLPGWEELLERLALSAGIDPTDSGFAELALTDRARVVERNLPGGRQELGERVAAVIEPGPRRFSLSHALLAGLPVRETVTTNYDSLYERAAAAAGKDLAVLPHADSGDGRPWLLKLHGSVERPKDIVLTREDYLRYVQSRGALGGLLQAMLLTRHMLFVGFGLNDDNFHRIVDEVRRALAGSSSESSDGTALVHRFGTALLLHRNQYQTELWRDELDLLAFDGELLEAARKVEVFLDRLLFDATDLSEHFLDPAYDGLLSPEERQLRELIQRLGSDAHHLANYREMPESRRVDEMLRALGYRFR